jgi:hypothetical protein
MGAIWRALRSRRKSGDPYEDFFLNAKPADPRNLIVNRIRQAPEGSVFAVKADTHTPEVMARHVKELGRFFGADIVHIAETRRVELTPSGSAAHDYESDPVGLPLAVLMLFRAEHDPREFPGIGGHVAALKGAHATFQVSAIIREFGFHATRVALSDPDGTVAALGLGSLDGSGRLKTKGLGARPHIADVILTDLPVKPDQPRSV